MAGALARWTFVLRCASVAAMLLAGTLLQGAEAAKFTIEALVRGTRVEGAPLVWSEKVVYLLSRDGRIWEFAPSEASDYRETGSGFRPYPANVLRGELERELGRDYEVSGTGHFLVAHPRGEKDRWAERFEEMYRSFVAYFSVRGLQPQPPPFPLVAIVWKNKEDFQRYSVRDGQKPKDSIVGYYSLSTNRVSLYDTGNRTSNQAQWERNLATVTHEAAHQTAFNTGIHNRFSPPPMWVAEGLGTLFEARGVNNSRMYTNQADRINRDRFEDFKRYRAKDRKADALMQMVSSDRRFEQDGGAAYAEAWMFTFFLIETQPREYARYLAKTASVPAFTQYTSASRLRDFTAVFGGDFRMLDARFLRFVDSLK